MLRKVICLVALGLAVLVGGCSSSDSVPNVAGTWKMVANVLFQFDMILAQNGGTITGSMIRTNGVEDVDTVAGTVESDGAINFTRTRAGVGGWTQIYTGAVTTSGGVSVMNGTFRLSTSSTSVPWQATKL